MRTIATTKTQTPRRSAPAFAILIAMSLAGPAVPLGAPAYAQAESTAPSPGDSAAPASSSPGDGTTPSNDPPTLVGAELVDVESCEDADACWQAATTALFSESFDQALAGFRSFGERFPGDARAPLAARIAAAIAATDGVDIGHGSAVRGSESAITSDSGRVELVIYSTLYSIGAGSIVAGIAAEQIDGLGPQILLLPAVTGIGGLVGSIFLTADRPITEGQAALISTVGRIGYVLGIEVPFAMEYGDGDFTPVGLTILGASSAALVGAVIAARQNPSIYEGDAALVLSGTIWGTVWSLSSLLLFPPDDDAAVARAALVGTLLGAGGGAMLATRFDVSRNRMRLIDLGGLLGGVTAFSMVPAFEIDNERVGGALLLGGTATGIALGALFTRGAKRLRDDRTAEGASLLPNWSLSPTMVTDGERVAPGFGLGGRW